MSWGLWLWGCCPYLITFCVAQSRLLLNCVSNSLLMIFSAHVVVPEYPSFSLMKSVAKGVPSACPKCLLFRVNRYSSIFSGSLTLVHSWSVMWLSGFGISMCENELNIVFNGFSDICGIPLVKLDTCRNLQNLRIFIHGRCTTTVASNRHNVVVLVPVLSHPETYTCPARY